MALDFSGTQAIIFDYGNTLIPFGVEQVRGYSESLGTALETLFGPLDWDRFYSMRAESRGRPFHGDAPTFAENDLRAITVELVEALYGRKPTNHECTALMKVRFHAFVDMIAADDYVPGLLSRLKKRFRLGLLSNYPDAPAIRASLEKLGIADAFDAVIVSADLGLCKPHPKPFQTMLQALGSTPEETVVVGDNWLADVQGAKRLGMRAVHMRRWNPPEKIQHAPDDHQPDAVIYDLAELETLIAQAAA